MRVHLRRPSRQGEADWIAETKPDGLIVKWGAKDARAMQSKHYPTANCENQSPEAELIKQKQKKLAEGKNYRVIEEDLTSTPINRIPPQGPRQYRIELEERVSREPSFNDFVLAIAGHFGFTVEPCVGSEHSLFAIRSGEQLEVFLAHPGKPSGGFAHESFEIGVIFLAAIAARFELTMVDPDVNEVEGELLVQTLRHAVPSGTVESLEELGVMLTPLSGARYTGLQLNF